MNAFKMAYRFLYFLVSCMIFPVVLFAQKEFNVMDWKTDVTLNTYLVQQMKSQYAIRRHKLEQAYTSRIAAEQYIQTVRNNFRQLLGSFPKKSKLNAKSTGFIREEQYSIEKLVYESFPGHHVTANIYLPKGKGPFPAALLFCGHEDISKATESYQKTAILFATHGFVVLVIDPISQSERYQLTDPSGKPLTRGGTTEHTLLNETSNLFALSTPADELWDNIRGLDYLVSRKEVDTSRIGCLGNSGGGMQAIYFAGFEPRIKVVAPCSFLMNRERALEITGPSDGCSQIPGEGYMGLEMSDYLMAAAPAPILVLAGRFDFIDYTGTQIAFNEIENMYRTLGHPEKVRMFSYDDGHGISQPKREAAVTWFRKWLYGDSTPVYENDIKTHNDQELKVTASGQVVSEFSKEITIAERNLRQYKSKESDRKKFSKKSKRDIIADIRKLLLIDENTSTVDWQETGQVEKNHILFHKIIIRKKGEVPIPALMLYPGSGAKKVVIWLSDNGKNRLADSAAFIRFYLQKQYALVIADLRGMGETTDKAELNDPKFYNREYRNAMLALHTGKSLVAQRVTDIGTILQFIASDSLLKPLPVELNAGGAASVPALHAALLYEEIATLNLYDAPASYQEILKDPVARNWYSFVVPGILNFYDLPDLARMVGAKKISYIKYVTETRTW